MDDIFQGPKKSPKHQNHWTESLSGGEIHSESLGYLCTLENMHFMQRLVGWVEAS